MAAPASRNAVPPLDLPPLYRLVTLREAGDAFATACALAEGEGAGTFVATRRFDLLEFAVVLEPEEPLAAARRAVFAGMVAMADALAAFAPPEKPLAVSWPTTLRFDAGRIGGGRLAWPERCAEDEVPAWLVFGGMILAAPTSLDPGTHPEVTYLVEEGFDPGEFDTIVESFARHLLLAFDLWAEKGFRAVADSYLARLPKAPGEGRRGIDGNGDLLVHREGGLTRLPLVPPLVAAEWYDPATGLPRL